jgi:hypothetical protein
VLRAKCYRAQGCQLLTIDGYTAARHRFISGRRTVTAGRVPDPYTADGWVESLNAGASLFSVSLKFSFVITITSCKKHSIVLSLAEILISRVREIPAVRKFT